MYSADETGCGVLPVKRCNDFKQTMKPKVAERAVACLSALKPGERCDPNRLHLCGHQALMTACVPPEDVDQPDGGPADDVATRCQAIVHGCAQAPIAPSMRDCRATLAGMTDVGRAKIAECMTKHCADKGLVGCEAMTDVK
jgi:hypothetical protein